jgi:NADH pyrophosphatase NudC (nudix superfamily)
VIRETLEETSIDLLENCRFLGVMQVFRSKPRPEVKVLPFVVLTENEPSIRLNEKELEDYFWIPLEELIKNRTTARLSFGKVPAFIVGSTVIWGLTYRIVQCFIQNLGTETHLGKGN